MTTSAKTRDQYHDMRRCYLPGNIRLVIVAESPPVSGLYFYDTKGKTTEPLFSALMKQLAFSPGSKEDGLKELQRRGWILVDATYEQINKTRAGRNKIIERDYCLLRDDVEKLLSDRSTPLICIKVNICKIVAPKLKKDGFNVINCGREIPFPSHSHQPKFHQEFSSVLKAAGIAA
jgi:hypothetical protein